MEITDLRCERLTGTLEEDPEEFYEERLASPLDVYGEFQQPSGDETYLPTGNEKGHHPYEEEGRLRVSHYFLHVETDEGVTGVAGPIDELWARLALRVRDLLVGRDPLATEKLWDLMYRQEVHGRKGQTMKAISAVDCALWDLKGRYYGEPVYSLLGGPTRERLPAYVSTLGYSVDPDRVRDRAAEFEERGFGAQKWFFRHGPGSGHRGMRENVALAAAARETVGEEYDLMFDCWMSWDRTYAEEMLSRLEPYNPRWVEEPVRPDDIEGYADLNAGTSVPIAGGEHEYTRWGAQELLARDAVDVLQVDTVWGGGISELQKVCALGSVHDVPVVPHGYSVPANVQVVAANPPTLCPFVEYLDKANVGLQFFFEEPIEPVDGAVPVPETSGLGVRLDDSKVDERTELDA